MSRLRDIRSAINATVRLIDRLERLDDEDHDGETSDALGELLARLERLEAERA